ncbi:MAG: DNA repair protein RecO [Alphaproteobacteria bacterium]
MPDWSDEAIILSARPFGEANAIVQVLTRRHGRHAGLVRGGASRRLRPVLQTGNRVQADWRARLADQLGQMNVELEQASAAGVLDSRERLAGLSAACAVAEAALPEREPHPAVYDGLVALIDSLVGLPADPEPLWLAVLVQWELGVLRELGFALVLDRCALTGVTDDLAWVSPRSGRAVSQDAAAPWSGRLLPLPPFLCGGPVDRTGLADGLALTGYFLERHVFAAGHRPLPAGRAGLAAVLGLDTGEPERSDAPDSMPEPAAASGETGP